MFTHYVELALRSFARSKALTTLMVLAIALGIGASMTTLTVFHALSGDPIPGKSGRLFYVQLDAASKAEYTPGEEPDIQLTRFDAESLLREQQGRHQVMMAAGAAPVQAVDGAAAGLAPFEADMRYSSADFFAMFDAPLRYGTGWSAADDGARARVVVLSAELNDKLYAGANSVGRTVRIGAKDFRIVGVLAPWRPVPHFYDLQSHGSYASSELAFLPFSTSRELRLDNGGGMNCWADAAGDQTALNAPCAWVQYWVQLDTAQDARRYRNYLDAYTARQRAAGRFERPDNTRLRSVMDWLDHNHVVPRDVRLQLWLAFGFLAVCLVNTVGLLLVKCLRRAPEIGVRRALGASWRQIFCSSSSKPGRSGWSAVGSACCWRCSACGACGRTLRAIRSWPISTAPCSRRRSAWRSRPA